MYLKGIFSLRKHKDGGYIFWQIRFEGTVFEILEFRKHIISLGFVSAYLADYEIDRKRRYRHGSKNFRIFLGSRS